MRAVVICTNRQWAAADMPFPAVVAGLGRLGYAVDVCRPDSTLAFRPPDVAVVWNGAKGPLADLVRGLRAADTTVLLLERGFFRRDRYTQIDPAGFNHKAGWAARLTDPAPPDGQRRLFKVLGCHPRPVRARRRGSVLVLGQVPGDAQLCDAPLHHADTLAAAVRLAVPADIEVRLRTHPLDRTGRSLRAPGVVVTDPDRPLAFELDEARFAVTINSNAGHDALAAGLPVLALGPSLLLQAGVGRHGRLNDLSRDMQAMLAGWRPDDPQTRNFLHWLACRQWNPPEIAEATPLHEALQRARRGTE